MPDTSVSNTGFWALLQKPWPWPVRVAAVLVLYGTYFLLGGGLNGERMPYDAGHYWELALSFQRQHRDFSLLYFDSPVRGYLAGALQLPALAVRLLLQCSMPTAAKMAGLGWASALLALVAPALWRSLGGQRVAGSRWLAFLGLSFVFWRDHFSFTTTDMPALTLLLLALWAPSKQSTGAWLLAGLSLAAAFNSRPVYVAAVPPAVALAAWWSCRHGAGHIRRAAALLVGMALALGPQLAINRVHFQRNTPLVLAEIPQVANAPLYLRQLTWGTRVLRYDTDLRQRLVYADSAGLALLRREGVREFSSYGQFGSVLIRHPLDYAARYLHHLFNGLDVWQPAPYLLRAYSPARLALQLLNYVALGLAVVACLAAWPRVWRSWPRASALLALLLPCVAALPTAIECRFLLPLHLLLLAVVAFQTQPSAWFAWLRGRPGRLVVAGLVAGLWLGSCFALSAATERALVPDRGPSLVD